TPGAPEDPVQASVARKVEQLRAAQEAGQLDPAWDPLDVLMFVNQIAMSWAGVTAPDDAFGAARRSAVVAAVERLFPR
ncbi:hypothetical protein ABZS66_61235, partial [Dactylosporangium sp. NPDC005572]|uniref:hypothetical protein n=1 Tax=Dactylosporangium sp. NPDC005572 TaxID=3156889 RepID=UPI0033A6CB2B